MSGEDMLFLWFTCWENVQQALVYLEQVGDGTGDPGCDLYGTRCYLSLWVWEDIWEKEWEKSRGVKQNFGEC